jgi:hypothetical protein
MSLPLRIVLLLNAGGPLSLGVLLFVAPSATFAIDGIVLPAEANFVAWLLGAAQLAIGAMCLGTLFWPNPAGLRGTVLALIVYHAASGVADTMFLMQAWSTGIAANLVVRVVMVALLAAFGLRTRHLYRAMEPGGR